jgi:undecaprenyl phosphate-alpha-L-ara4N flippase subunit ArnF
MVIDTKKAFALVLCSSVLTSIAQILFKLAFRDAAIPPGHGPVNAWGAIMHSASWGLIAAGIVLYGISLLCWIFALTRLPVSLAYPMLSLSYVFVYFAATLMPSLGETGARGDLVALMLVVTGIVVLAIDLARQASESEPKTPD